MKALDTEQILRLCDVLLRALGTRMQSFVALLMTSVLFAWAMYRSTWLSFAIAAAFGIGVLWPILFVGSYGRGKDEEA